VHFLLSCCFVALGLRKHRPDNLSVAELSLPQIARAATPSIAQERARLRRPQLFGTSIDDIPSRNCPKRWLKES
jgi:hypothetical protein